MTQRRARRLLLAALAFSLLFHLLIALVWRRSAPALDQPEYVTVRPSIVQLTHAPRPALPRRTLRTRVPVLLAPAHTVFSGKSPGRGPGHAAASQPQATNAPASPTPLPRASPSPAASAAACTKPDIGPSVAATADPPAIAPVVRAQNASGVATVKVGIDATGRVLDTTVASSSGSTSLDLVALGMARTATYSPKYEACKAVAGTYTFTVKFVAW